MNCLFTKYNSSNIGKGNNDKIARITMKRNLSNIQIYIRDKVSKISFTAYNVTCPNNLITSLKYNQLQESQLVKF